MIAFPTQLSYSRLLNHAKSAYHAYHNLGKFVELGENVNIHNNVNASANANVSASTDVSTNADADTDANANALDPQSRSKLNAAGTNLWNTIQKHPGLFMDVISNLNSRDYSHGHDNGLLNDNDNEHDNEHGNEREIEREHGDQSKSSSKTVPIPPHVIANQKLERVRGAASGYIRALVCRMILISKFKTCALDIAELVEVDGVHVSASSSSASASALVSASASASASVTLPCALSSELEFGLKCFSRAGRAILVHSEDYESAFRVLSLAIVCWRGLEKTHTHTHTREHEHGHDHDHQDLHSGAGAGGLVGGHARNEAFDALLLLPDCASKFVTSTAHYGHGKRGGERERDAEAEAVDADCGNCYDEKNNDDDEDYSPSSKRIIAQLQQLEDFVHDQRVSTTKPLFATQHYLPSLARIGYKVS